MTQLPSSQALTRFVQNEERVDIWTNQNGHYDTNETSPREVETIPSMMARLQQRYLTGIVRGDWVTGTAYAINDIVIQSGLPYIVVSAHTSGTFATDLAAGKLALYTTNTIVTADGKRYKLLCGTLAKTGGTWGFLNDTTHDLQGFTGVTENVDGTLTLEHDVDGVKIAGFHVCPYSLSEPNGEIKCNVLSVGLTTSMIAFSSPVKMRVYPGSGTPAISYINAVADGLFSISVNATLSTIKLVHTSVPIPTWIRPSYDIAEISVKEIKCVRTSQTITEFNIYEKFRDVIEYNSGVPGWLTTIHSIDNPTIAFTWDTDHLDINIEGPVLFNKIPIVTSLGIYHAMLTLQNPLSSNDFTVTFYDMTGTKITTVDDNMKFAIEWDYRSLINGSDYIGSVPDFYVKYDDVFIPHSQPIDSGVLIQGLIEF